MKNLTDTGGFKGKVVDACYFDGGISRALLSFFEEKNITSLVDIGCGEGQYVNFFNKNGIHSIGYEGNPDVEKLTANHKPYTFAHGKCHFKDFALPCEFGEIFQWGICIEVGEHIPKKYEDTFLKNIDSCITDGLIISWAIPGQGGHGHVNCQTNQYIKDKFKSMGYENFLPLETSLRKASQLPWTKKIMAFKKLPL
jgi:cyclopropane fatty-acyl-phospholipid synthase-like methyltransferase